MVMVEALACGTPVIAFPAGAASELVSRRPDRLSRRGRDRDGRGRRARSGASPRVTAEHGSPSTATWMSLPAPMSPPTVRPPARESRRWRLSERTLSVLDGSTFVVSDRLGDVRYDGGREHGFFCHDTRFLSHWVLRVSETPLELLGLDQAEHFCSPLLPHAQRRPGDRGAVLDHAPALDRSRLDGGDIRHQSSPREQHDRGGARARHGLRRPVRGQGRDGRKHGMSRSVTTIARSTLSYERDGFRRSVTIASSLPAAVTREGFAYSPTLAPGEQWSTTFTITPGAEQSGVAFGQRQARETASTR